MLARLDNRSCLACCALGVDQFDGIYKLATAVTLVTFGIAVAATLQRAAALDHAICQWRVARVAVLLLQLVFVGVSLLHQVVEYVLRNLRLLFCCSSAKIVEVTVEPLVNLCVFRMVKVANLLTCFPCLAGLCLCGRAIFIRATDVDGIMTSESRKSGIDIGREDTSNDIAKMRHIVHVWQRTRDQNIPLALHWQYFFMIESNNFRVRGADADCRFFIGGCSGWRRF